MWSRLRRKNCLLLYADDVVLIAELDNNLQIMLDELNSWCGSNSMPVNSAKSKVVHLRPLSGPRTQVGFKCGG